MILGRAWLFEKIEYTTQVLYSISEYLKWNAPMMFKYFYMFSLEKRLNYPILCTQFWRVYQGVCQIFDTEFPDFSLTFFLVFPDSLSTFYQLSPGIYPLKIINFWNVSKFWYFFFILLSVKKDFLISLKFPGFPRLFTDFSLISLTFLRLFRG